MKIINMKQCWVLLIVLLSYDSTFAQINTYSAVTGNWNTTANWSLGHTPLAGEDVVVPAAAVLTINIATNSLGSLTIADGGSLTVSQSLTCTSVTVGAGISGVLQYNTGNTGRAIIVSGNVIINAGASITAGATGTATNTLSITGDLINNGTLNAAAGAGPNKINITFTGAASNSLTTSVTAVTTFNLITITKTANTNILDFNPSNTVGLPAGFLTLTSGTLKISGIQVIANTFFNTAAYTIPAIAGFWLNNPNATVNGQSGIITLNGILRVTQGSFYAGTTTISTLTFTFLAMQPAPVLQRANTNYERSLHKHLRSYMCSTDCFISFRNDDHVFAVIAMTIIATCL